MGSTRINLVIAIAVAALVTLLAAQSASAADSSTAAADSTSTSLSSDTTSTESSSSSSSSSTSTKDSGTTDSSSSTTDSTPSTDSKTTTSTPPSTTTTTTTTSTSDCFAMSGGIACPTTGETPPVETPKTCEDTPNAADCIPDNPGGPVSRTPESPGGGELPFTGPGDVLLALLLAMLAGTGGILLMSGANGREELAVLNGANDAPTGWKRAYRELLADQVGRDA